MSSDNAERRQATVVLGGCALSALLVVLGIAALAIHVAVDKPPSPYQATFAKVGDACGRNADSMVILDQTSGGLLVCSLVGFGATGATGDTPRGPFSAAEVQQITTLSTSLATNHTALTDADQRTVEHLAEDIGRRHGRPPSAPTTLDRVTGTQGPWLLAFGLMLLFGLGVWLYRRDR